MSTDGRTKGLRGFFERLQVGKGSPAFNNRFETVRKRQMVEVDFAKHLRHLPQAVASGQGVAASSGCIHPWGRLHAHTAWSVEYDALVMLVGVHRSQDPVCRTCPRCDSVVVAVEPL